MRPQGETRVHGPYPYFSSPGISTIRWLIQSSSCRHRRRVAHGDREPRCIPLHLRCNDAPVPVGRPYSVVFSRTDQPTRYYASHFDACLDTRPGDGDGSSSSMTSRVFTPACVALSVRVCCNYHLHAERRPRSRGH